MDRDVAMSLRSSLNSLKEKLQTLATNTTPPDNRAKSIEYTPDPGEEPDEKK